ncbi:hypothetical protein ACL9ST_16620 [Bacillus australimaris]|uniref:hypothetical protein n=1 Tax=Bacillus australimaris TaxID=1326968 RepID=UPI0039B3E64F
MLLQPKELENIIVGVLNNNIFTWYITPEDLWFLDRKKQVEAFGEKFQELGIPHMSLKIEDINDERKGLEILDEKSFKEFLPRIKKFAVLTEELRESLKLNLNFKPKEEVFYQFSPSLFINIDKKSLYSMYTEPASYEDFVPKHWNGFHEDFLSKIDRNYKYWNDKNNVDMLDLESNE